MGRGGAEVEHQAGMMAWHAATLGANAMKLPRRTLLRLTAGAAALPLEQSARLRDCANGPGAARCHEHDV